MPEGIPGHGNNQGMQIKRALISSRAKPNHSYLYFTHYCHVLAIAKTNSKSRSVEFVDAGTELKRGSACVTLSHSMRESHSRTPPEPHSNPALLASPFPPSHRAGLLGAGLSAHLSPLNPFPGSSGDGSMTWPSGQISDYRSRASELTTGESVGPRVIAISGR